MEKIKSVIKNNLLLIMSIAAGVLILGGVALIVLALTLSNTAFYKVMFIIMSIVMVLLGCVVTYFVLLVKDNGLEDEEPNLFLYDAETERNLSADILTFDLVNKRMAFFMSRVSNSIREIWTENVFDNDEAFDGVDELKTLLAYKMIYDLADKDIPGLWELYLNADSELIEEIEINIANNGDEFGKYIVKLHATANGNYEKSRKFLTDNKAYLENKMFNCVKRNIEKF